MIALTDRYLEVVEADDTNPNTITKPPGKWRNWARVTRAFYGTFSGRNYKIGDLVPGGLWPSKDVAESNAAKYEGDASHMLGDGCAKYLGAFPEGETPPE